MRSTRMRKTTKEMTAHYAAIQQGVCERDSSSFVRYISFRRLQMRFVVENLYLVSIEI